MKKNLKICYRKKDQLKRFFISHFNHHIDCWPDNRTLKNGIFDIISQNGKLNQLKMNTLVIQK